MRINKEDLLGSMMESMDRITYIRPEEIPGIDLYMDQVLGFINDRMLPSTRNPGEDKILTKTMINNYTKNDLLPPPNRKKYSREHMLLLIFIYYYKGLLSINDIRTLLAPITEQYFQAGDAKMRLEDIYNEVFGLEKDQIETLKKDVTEKYRLAGDTFSEAKGEEKERLQLFSFICLLSFDVYTKRLLVEKIIDELREDTGERKK